MKNVVIAVVVVALLGAGAFALTRSGDSGQSNTTEPSHTESTTQNAEDQPAQTEAAETNTVAIEDFAYTPATITVKKGTTVTWTNRDSAVHTVTSDEGDLMDSGNMSRGDTYSVTFNETGTFTYHCEPHPNMTGTVVVTE